MKEGEAASGVGKAGMKVQRTAKAKAKRGGEEEPHTLSHPRARRLASLPHPCPIARP